ncbi:MAG: AzlD domain-containing protein [Peptoniphilaceae bacterium]|nr:AzlD domain-containing protein [Peptoniphilaceae bacterium]MDY6019751.1 AzlD domain-containing protein [Anaerococcus sp.]
MTREAWITILIPAIITFLLRATPFIFFSKKEVPEIILYIGKYLPFAMMGLLVVFALKGINFLSYPFGIPEAICVVTVILLHLWKRNMLISIGGGTILYMFIVQTLV